MNLSSSRPLSDPPGNVSLSGQSSLCRGELTDGAGGGGASPTEHSPHRTLTRVTLMRAGPGYLFIQREYKWFNYRKVGFFGIMRAK